jgi:uncharacterized protein GlcG (DUF336 family)
LYTNNILNVLKILFIVYDLLVGLIPVCPLWAMAPVGTGLAFIHFSRRASDMSALNLHTATTISNRALALGRELSAAPLTVAVLDAGGHLISLQREDGASLLRPQIAIAKAWGAVALGKGSRAIAADAQQRPAFIGALNNLADGKLLPAAGGVLIRDVRGEVIGAIGITGDTSDIDEQCAIGAVQAAGLKADAGQA